MELIFLFILQEDPLDDHQEQYEVDPLIIPPIFTSGSYTGQLQSDVGNGAAAGVQTPSPSPSPIPQRKSNPI